MAETTTASSDETLEQIVERTGAAMRAGNFDAANDIAKQALEAGMDHPFLLKARGLWLNANNEHQEALRAFHHARELAPDDPLALNGIAAVLGAMGQYRPALKVLDESLNLAPDMAPTHYLRGWCFENSGESENARDAYLHTLSLQPNNVQALAGLASVSAHLDDFIAARDCAQRALSFQPTQPTANLALATAEIAAGAADLAEQRVRKLLSGKISGQTRALALRVLGEALDKQNRTREAFDAFAAKNEALRNLLQGRLMPEAVFEKSLRDLQANLLATAGRWAGPESGPIDGEAKAHAFIIGFPRSGSLLIQKCLGLHPDVDIQAELDLLAEAAQSYLADETAISNLLSASPGELDAIRQTYWQHVQEQHGSVAGKVFIEALPFNTIKLPLIARLFPRAHIFFTVRDTRDVVLGNFRRPVQENAISFDLLSLEGIARAYDATMEIGDWSRKNLPLTFHVLRQETAMKDFGKQVDGICAILGLTSTDEMTAFARDAELRTDEWIVRRSHNGFSDQDIGHWRKYAAELEPVMPILARWLDAFEYPRD